MLRKGRSKIYSVSYYFFLIFHWEFYLIIYFLIYFLIKNWLIAKEKAKKISENVTLSLNGKSSIY